MRVNCREQIANPAEPVNGQDERWKCAAIPHSRSITCPQATTFAQQNRPLQKENTILTDGISFFSVIVHRFCCLHSRPPQGRGRVRGEPLTGSPARVQSPARRRPLLRSKSAAPKRNTILTDGVSFWSRVRESNPP